MAIGSQESVPLISLLRIIFSQGKLTVSLAGLTDLERSRNIAFYDEVITASVRLSIPASKRTLAAPSNHARSSFSIPVRTADLYDDEGFGEDEERSSLPPPLLVLLLCSLSVSLEAGYVPPRLSRGPHAAGAGEGESASNTQVIASVEEEDAAYQAVRLQGGDVNSEATKMFHRAWSGNSLPPKPELKKPASRKGKEAIERQSKSAGGAEIWFAREHGEEHWTVEWRCHVPIVFLRFRHPTPALVLSANLTMQLQPSRLSTLAPSLASPATTSASEALFMHDLLNPLSEGPSYPDESPAERAARADASLAKLPLGKLPSSILGSKLITPARGAKEVGRLVEARRRLTLENGDMGDAEEYNSLKAGRRDLTNEGLLGQPRDASSIAMEGDMEQGLGEDVVVARRSARRALDVRSAVLVRMRTTNIAGVGERFGEPPTRDNAEDNTVPTLVLCVEVENPANSGIKFALEDVGVQVAVPSEPYGALHPSARVHVEVKPIGTVPTSLVVEQGSQFNMLYRVDFSLPYQGPASDNGVIDPSTLMAETQRTVTIELFGRPVMLRRTADRAGEEFSPADNFTSTWSCTLDFATQIQILVLQRVIADGAGGFALGKFRDEMAALHANARLPHLLSSVEHTATLPSVVAQRRIESLHQPPVSPSPRASSMANGRPTLNRVQTDVRMPSGRSAAVHRPSLRTSAAYLSDSFVSLQRSPISRQGESMDTLAQQESALTPAMPSSLVGPSILARARKNRLATLGAMSTNAETDEARRGPGRRSTLIASSRVASEAVMMPGRVSSSSWHVKNALSGSQPIEGDALPVVPLGSKATWVRVPYLIQNAGVEQGLLIDIICITKLDGESKTTTATKDKPSRTVHVQLQIDNRSEVTRTLLLQWKWQASSRQRATFSDGASLPTDMPSWLADDDAVQVGPIVPGQAELTTLCLHEPVEQRTTDGEKPQTIPPLLLIDVESGLKRTLTCMQPLVA